MAVFKPGPAISDIRGSINGVTFGRNRAGLFMRQRVAPVQPNTPVQTLVRNFLATLQTRYRVTLTEGQRLGWDSLGTLAGGIGALGDRIRLTGQQAYIRTNSIRLRGQLATIDDAPAAPFEIPCTKIVLSGAVLVGLQLDSVLPALVAGDLLQVQISAPYSQARYFCKGPYPTYTLFHSLTVFPVVLVLPADCAVDDRFFVRARYVDLVGRVSVHQYYVENIV